jgi:hypothetical protein
MGRRAAFFICGVVTVLIGRVFGSLQRYLPAQEIAWSRFSYPLLIVGIAAVLIALLPTAWVQNARAETTEPRRFTPFRFLLGFAALGFLLVIVFGIIPPRYAELPTPLVYSLCPACVVSVTVDSSMRTAVFLIGPLNALAFGAIGGVIGTSVRMISDRFP